ncbi:YbaB/EbfC family nucleoid-associated protein [Brachyspira sp. G79]|uniref:YbaB/EbfC family nucleoid-associated protein n=1 Tax=Brachyspira sp. G79 TaxID=1358104 RepID=UPI000BBCB864|nr:YbaB/EbfC family nucleoid-associated protein [Brachyspira sp. G79]PCG18831.1 valyl-tRNA synthetase [Brachyspira sp. G79]
MNENTIKYSSAGNLVSFNMDKLYKISNFNIDESLLSKDQKELLEEMIVSSINEASHKVKELNKKLEEDNNTEEKPKQVTPFNMNWGDMSQMFNDISKMTSVEYKDGKLNISLDSITPDMISKMNDMMNKMNDKDDENNNKE